MAVPSPHPDNAAKQQLVELVPGPHAWLIHVYLLRIEKSRGQLTLLAVAVAFAASGSSSGSSSAAPTTVRLRCWSSFCSCSSLVRRTLAEFAKAGSSRRRRPTRRRRSWSNNRNLKLHLLCNPRADTLIPETRL